MRSTAGFRSGAAAFRAGPLRASVRPRPLYQLMEGLRAVGRAPGPPLRPLIAPPLAEGLSGGTKRRNY